jgi:hypothetical protein
MPTTKPKPRVRVKPAPAAKPSGLRYSFKLEGELNISAYVARQIVNEYLLLRVSSQIGADEPELELHAKGAYWVVPVILGLPRVGRLDPLGQIIVDAQYGHILEDRSTSCEEIEAKAHRLAEEEAL